MAPPNRTATLYLRNVPARLVREAKVRAARDGTTLTAVVVDALAKSLEASGETQAPAEPDLRDSIEWYEANRANLLRRYRDEYVAIVGRKVVDHDAHFAALAARVFARMGTKPIFMPRVTEHAERVRVRSPRRKRS
jgi:plasmid stability protein